MPILTPRLMLVVALTSLPTPATAQCLLERITAADAFPNAQFGFSVSIDGALAVVGANGENNAAGAAYVLERDGSMWEPSANLVASDASAYARFGRCVSVSGDRVLVGARDADAQRGAAYVFVRTLTGWTEECKLVPANAVAGDEFGTDVALWGDTAVVGSYLHDGIGVDSGAAYVFERTGSTWVETCQLTGSDTAPFDEYGWSVAIRGDRLLVGAHHNDNKQGAVYVYERVGSCWDERAKLEHFDPQDGDHLGTSVALFGDTVVSGSHLDGHAGHRSGSAYVFEERRTGWVQTDNIKAFDAEPGDLFGWSVALWGDRILVGAPELTTPGGAGDAYLFERGDAGWTQAAQLTPVDASFEDWFGWSVALQGGWALIGAPLDDSAVDVDAGSVRSALVDESDCDGNCPTPNTYCTAKVNSMGCLPAIAYSGLPTVTGADDFRVTASNVLNNQYGFMLFAANPNSLPFYGGTLCLSPPLRRSAVQFSGGNPPPSDCSGTFDFLVGQDFLTSIGQGTQFYAQCWYRDTGLFDLVGLTDGLAWTICP